MVMVHLIILTLILMVTVLLIHWKALETQMAMASLIFRKPVRTPMVTVFLTL